MSSAKTTDRLDCQTLGCDTHCPDLGDGSVQRDGTMRCVDCWDYYRAHGEWPTSETNTDPEDVPVLEEAGEDTPTEEKVEAFLDDRLADADYIEVTCGEVGDAVGEDGRAIPHAFRALDEDSYDIAKTGNETETGAAVWAIKQSDEHRVGDPIDEDDVQDDSDAGESGGSADSLLPAGLSVADVEDAVDAACRGPNGTGRAYLGDVADELNVRKKRARLFCHAAGVYADVTDASGDKGGDD